MKKYKKVISSVRRFFNLSFISLMLTSLVIAPMVLNTPIAMASYSNHSQTKSNYTHNTLSKNTTTSNTGSSSQPVNNTTTTPVVASSIVSTTASVFTSVAVVSSQYTVKVGGTSQFVANLKDQNDNPYVGTVSTTFKSSNPSVATVNSSTGLVTGVSVGTATITATSISGTTTSTDTADATVTAATGGTAPIVTTTPTAPVVTAPVVPPTTPVVPPVTSPVVTTPVVVPPATTPAPTSSMQWGAFLPSGTLSSFESMVGKSANMQATFVGWNTSFPTSMASSLKSGGKTIVIFWENTGTSLDSIIAGSSDSYISSFAAAAKASGASVILAPFHEMNGDWDTWDGTVGSNTPAKVVAAWKHMHDLFSGVTNVKFAWDVNNVSEPDTAANAISVYYPGSSYVDYVAVDGFNFGTDTWDQVFPSSLMNQLSSYGKPVYILSTASVPGSGKAQWITDMGAHIKNYPSVVGWVWFDQNGADGNWVVDSDTASLAAFKSILP